VLGNSTKGQEQSEESDIESLQKAEADLARVRSGEFRDIIKEYSGFSGMDEVVLRMAEVSLREDDWNTARNHLWKVVCGYPNGRRVNRAFERLNQIGFGAWQGCDQYR